MNDAMEIEEEVEGVLREVSALLKKKELSLATAESCTGGMLANLLTNISGSSTYFDRGVVSYSNRSKMELLGVKRESLEKWGAVSPQIAMEMAVGIKERAGVDMGISTTGVAGPTGGSKEKPVGLVFIGCATKNGVVTKRCRWMKDRLGNKAESCRAALELILAGAQKL